MSDTNSKARMEVMQGVASGLGFWGHMTGASGQRLFDAAQQLCREGKALMSQINDGGLSDYRYIVYAPDERFDRQELSVVKASPGVTPGETKVTPGPCQARKEAFPELGFGVYVHTGRYIALGLSREDAHLIAEAFNVFHETGMGPRRLADERLAAKAALAALSAQLVRSSDAFETEHAALSTRVRELEAALEMMYDKYEDGSDCYEEPETFGGYIGKAVQISDEEEKQILKLIPSERDALLPQVPTNVGDGK